jgi:hypothetical protein
MNHHVPVPITPWTQVAAALSTFVIEYSNCCLPWQASLFDFPTGTWRTIETTSFPTPTRTVTAPIHALAPSGFPFPYLWHRDRFWDPTVVENFILSIATSSGSLKRTRPEGYEKGPQNSGPSLKRSDALRPPELSTYGRIIDT